jgi:PAS domain-containing protein
VFFWSTDTALRVRTVTGAASEVVGLSRSKVEGRDVIAIFGMEGPNLDLLDAHVAALNGETAEFTLEGARASVRCQVAPTHDALDRVIGTFCLAITVERVDLREVPEPAAVA